MKKALDKYLHALKLMVESEKTVPREIWNNIAVLYHQTEAKKNYLKAETYYRRALLGDFGYIPSDEEVQVS